MWWWWWWSLASLEVAAARLRAHSPILNWYLPFHSSKKYEIYIWQEISQSICFSNFMKYEWDLTKLLQKQYNTFFVPRRVFCCTKLHFSIKCFIELCLRYNFCHLARNKLPHSFHETHPHPGLSPSHCPTQVGSTLSTPPCHHQSLLPFFTLDSKHTSSSSFFPT